MDCLGTTVTEADLLVLTKSSGLGYPGQDCCVGGKFEVNWLELFLVGQNGKRKSTCAATSTRCASSGQSDDSPSQPDGEERLFNPKPKSLTAMGSGDLLVGLQRGTRASPNVNSLTRHLGTRCRTQRPHKSAGT